MPQVQENNILVSVVMPVYNAAPFLKQAIKSILHQTYTNFELIIVDDGSTDLSPNIIEQFTDKRIRYIRFEKNKGIVEALNTGLRHAKGKYIARMDADDISLEHRIDFQVKFLEAHPEIGILGTQHQGLGKHARKLPLTHDDICWFMLNASPFVHPSVMFRASLNLTYDVAFEYAEDLALWVECCDKTQLANLKEVCIAYRYHHGTHQQQLTVAAKHNRVLKLQMVKKLLPQLHAEHQQQLVGYLNQHQPQAYSLTWFDAYLKFCDEWVALVNQPQFTKVLQRNVWFHLASSPQYYFPLRKRLQSSAWIGLSFTKKIWLVAKPYVKMIYK